MAMSQLRDDMPGAPGTDAPGTDAAGRPYHPKRPHRKSRAGCQNCKNRKVKCDEARPRCRACTLRKEACVYPSPSPARGLAKRPAAANTSNASSAASPNTVTLSSSSSSSSSPPAGCCLPSHDDSRSYSTEASSTGSAPNSGVPRQQPHAAGAPWALLRGREPPPGHGGLQLLQEPLFLPAQFDVTDMRLLWFYTARGFGSFAAELGPVRRVDRVLKVVIPEFAFRNTFLMDSLLAVSAIEMKLLGQSIGWRRVLEYRNRAMESYGRAVQQHTPESLPALLVCSFLLCAVTSDMFRDAGGHPLFVINWMGVWRGIGLIIKLIPPRVLFESGLAIVFARPPIDLDASARYVPGPLLFLVRQIRPGDKDAPHMAQYLETLKFLGSLYRELAAGIGRILGLRAVTWFTFLPASFAVLVRERRPRALIILAHYLVFVKLAGHQVWWMRGIADKEINDIRALLGDEWRLFLTAPLAALETDDETLLGRILLNSSTWTPGHHHDPATDSQARSLTLVDSTGHNLVFRGALVREDTGEPAAWEPPEPLDSAPLPEAFEAHGTGRLGTPGAEHPEVPPPPP